jgi:hypothetical protein
MTGVRKMNPCHGSCAVPACICGAIPQGRAMPSGIYEWRGAKAAPVHARHPFHAQAAVEQLP